MMKNQRQGALGKAFDSAMAPVRFLRKHIGYDSAMSGWDNEEPMSGPSRRTQALKEVFSKHAKRSPLLIVLPTTWMEVTSDLSKALAPNTSSKLMPKFQYTSFEDDMKKFKPDPRLKERLQESTAMDTSRSFMRSSMKILSMYWSKAGVKETSIAAVLAAATFYCTLKSVDVQATFSYWGRDFNDFLLQAFNSSGELKEGILNSMKDAYDMNMNDSDLLLLKTIITEAQYNFDSLDVTSALSGLRISPETISQITESINTTFGDLELERFIGGENREQLENLIKDLPIPSQFMDAIVEQVSDAVINQADVKHASQILVDRVAENFSHLDPQALSVLDGAMNEFSSLQSQLGQLSITFEHNFTLPQILTQDGPQAALDAILSGINDFNADTLNAEEIGPERIEYMRELHATMQEQINSSQPEILETLTKAAEGQEIVDDLGQLMAKDIFNTSKVVENVDHLTNEVPRSFSGLLGQFLLYALPAAYTAQHLALRWQTWMTGKLTNEWNKYGAAYKLKFEHTNVDNPDQRISENMSQITNFATDVSTDGMQNAMTLAAFIPILNAMGDFNPSVLGGPDMVIPNFMTWAAFGWSATAAVAMGAIAYTLPKLTRKTQHANGDFRAGLISVQSQPEQIALAQGEKFEKGLLKKIHRRAVDLDVKMINKRMQMMVFNSIEGNVGNYVPYLFTVPLGMGAMLTFGTAMQAAGIFRTVDRSVDFVKRTIPQFAIVKANVDRIAQLIDGIDLSKYEMLEKEYYRRLQDGETTPSGDTGHQPAGPAL